MEDTICLQCGDKGFDNAFVHCVRCLNFALHRYCLDVLPKTPDEYVRWVCDDCAEKLKSHFPAHEGDYSPSHSEVLKNINGLTRNGIKENDLVVVKTETDEPICKDGPEQSYDAPEKLHSIDCGKSANQSTLMQLEGKNDEQNSSSHKIEGKKVQTKTICKYGPEQTYDAPAKLHSMDCGKSANQATLVQLEAKNDEHNSSSHKIEGKKVQTKTIKKKKKRKTRKLNLIGCDNQHKLGKASTEQSHEESMEVVPTVSPRSATDSTLPSKVKENKVSGQPFVSDNDPGSLEHPVVSADGPARSSKKEKTVDLSMLISNDKGLELGNQCPDISFDERKVDMDEDVLAAEPVVMPIWRGCFSILNKKYDNLDEVVAHASSKACLRVFEAASQFEPMLQFEMLPKSEIWPKSFQKSEPSANIALYFFPSKISEQDFDVLVDKMIKEDLGLKAVMQNAELLIFNSTELPLRYWRFQGKYYIWGVFRGKQKPPSQCHSVAKIPSTKAGGSPPSCGSHA